MDYRFHPLCEQYPLLSDAELERIAADMKEHGFDPKYPIYRYEEQIVIGRNRLLAAERAGVDPVIKELKLKNGETLEQLIERDNDNRRHQSQEELRKNREQRIARAALASANGESTRTIAEKEGVSQGQVRRDLKDASFKQSSDPGESPDSPGSDAHQNDTSQEPEKTNKDTSKTKTSNEKQNNKKVTGKDGRKQSATKKKMFCDRCTRVGAVKDCGQCAVLRESVKSKPKAATPSKNGSPLIDNKKIATAMGKLVRMLHDRAVALKQEKSDAYRDIRESMETVLTSWERWLMKEATK